MSHLHLAHSWTSYWVIASYFHEDCFLPFRRTDLLPPSGYLFKIFLAMLYQKEVKVKHWIFHPKRNFGARYILAVFAWSISPSGEVTTIFLNSHTFQCPLSWTPCLLVMSPQSCSHQLWFKHRMEITLLIIEAELVKVPSVAVRRQWWQLQEASLKAPPAICDFTSVMDLPFRLASIHNCIISIQKEFLKR
jgi:hypothetical protein